MEMSQLGDLSTGIGAGFLFNGFVDDLGMGGCRKISKLPNDT